LLTLEGADVDPELTSLVTAGATAVVTAMATNAWEGVRDTVLRLFRQAKPARRGIIEAKLDNDAAYVAQASDTQATRDAVLGNWIEEFSALLSERPDLAASLADLTERGRTPGARDHAATLRMQTNIARDRGMTFAVQDGGQHVQVGTESPAEAEEPRYGKTGRAPEIVETM
jgi:hypothetical protein